uniref:GRIP domain-containing protein n=1 Tax=Pseudo-nitzschia australis TaxID=44445 RepID=A0A6V0ADG8_9STRA|mmetsp:Transcript_20559/g.44745  ORF Transcript_20559/g.44745 Transcript_20559/m.44745 type:complete len:1028 (+) Transcript_20559:90-3173(+)
MWSNLAKGLGASDINATLEKIGNAVAPREDEDDDYDEDDEYYDDEDDQYYADGDDDGDGDDEDNGNGNGDGDGDENANVNVEEMIKKVASNVTPFRLAGMLTRALDDRHAEIGNRDGDEIEDESGHNSCENEKINTEKLYPNNNNNNNNNEENSNTKNLDRVLFPREMSRQTDGIVPQGDKNNDAGNDDSRIEVFAKETGDDGVTNPNSKTTSVEIGPLGNSLLQSKDTNNFQRMESSSDDPAAANEEPSKDTEKNIINTSVEIAIKSQKADEEKAEHILLIPEKTATERKLLSEIRTKTDAADTKGIDNNDSIAIEKYVATDEIPIVSKPKEKENNKQEQEDSSQSFTPILPVSDSKEQEEKFVPKNEDTNVAVNMPTAGTSKATVMKKGASRFPKEKDRPKIVVDDSDSEFKTWESDFNAHSNDDNERRKLNTSASIKKPENTKENNDINSSIGNVSVTTKESAEKPSGVIDEMILPPSPQNHEIPLDIAQGKNGLPLRNDEECPKSQTQVHIEDNLPRANEDTEQKLSDAKFDHEELKLRLELANQEIEALQKQAQRDKEKAESEKEDLVSQFHSKEIRLLQATSEENQNQTLLLQQEHSAKIQHLEHLLGKERRQSQDEQAEYKKLLRESYATVDHTESQLKATLIKHENDMVEAKKQEERALRKLDDRMAQTMAVLDERDEEISRLKKSIRNMESKVSEHKEGEEEAEEELEELHNENDSLRVSVAKLELDKKQFKEQIEALKSGSEELSRLQMELTMLTEERGRERTKNQATLDSALVSRAQIESERDNAFSQLKDSKQQLAAALGDLEIAHSDNTRMMTANENLQSALEVFQDERLAEMQINDEQRRESEEAIKSANAISTNALRQIHETEMYEIQKASDNAVKNVMQEMELVQGTKEKLKSENHQMRRSLDEAIHRLQTTQEDVIDRNVMKNILVDWCTLNDKNKRHQVLEIMANLLHFSEEEKERVHLTSKSLDSVRAKVVGALAVPLPPSKADVEHLEGSNVHEKWVNFLLAETDDT